MPFIVLAAVTFILHLAWEKAHIGLYRNYDALKGVVPVPVWAALGDIVYTGIAVGVIALLKGNILWFLSSSPMDYLQMAGLGFMTALFVEYKAFRFKRWEYTERMPLLAGFNIGLSPAVQKTFLFPISIWVTNLALTVIS